MSARDEHQALFARAMDPATAAAHADMDETGKWGAEHCQRRLTGGELDAAIDEDRRYFIAAETSYWRQTVIPGRLPPPIAPSPAEACTELGADDNRPRRERLGPLGPVGRWVLGHPVHIMLAVGLAVLYLIGRSMGATA